MGKLHYLIKKKKLYVNNYSLNFETLKTALYIVFHYNIYIYVLG